MGATASQEDVEKAREMSNSAKVVVFSKTYCGYCAQAKSALKPFNVQDMKVYELDERSDGAAIQAAMQSLTGGSTVPRVFVGGKFIGGGSETAALARSGELERLLKAAGAI